MFSAWHDTLAHRDACVQGERKPGLSAAFVGPSIKETSSGILATVLNTCRSFFFFRRPDGLCSFGKKVIVMCAKDCASHCRCQDSHKLGHFTWLHH